VPLLADHTLNDSVVEPEWLPLAAPLQLMLQPAPYESLTETVIGGMFVLLFGGPFVLFPLLFPPVLLLLLLL
jgi:hypothetical protein